MVVDEVPEKNSQSNVSTNGPQCQEFDAILSWSMNSLDTIRSQLIAVCFPIFVNT